MRVFVAGGTGAIGRQMIPQLVAAGHAVTAISRQPGKIAWLRDEGAHGVLCDVFHTNKLTTAVRDAAPDAIVNQLTALPATMNPRHLGAHYEANNRVRQEGTANLLAAARQASVDRMVVQSMATWYEPKGSPIKSENDPLWTDAPEPIGTAVRTVLQMENAALHDLSVAVVLRYGAFYGPGTWYASDGDIAGRVRKRAFPVIGSGSGIMSFIHVDDAASAVVAALAARSSGVYNIVDDEPATATEWLPVYAQALGARPPRPVPEFLARLMLGRPLTTWLTTMRGAANAHAAAALGWRPRYPSWRNGFAATLAG
jgi:nucleoside-diphosphate-sugar epimerase